MDNFMPWLIRPQAEEIKRLLLEQFRDKLNMARVYLAIDGLKAVKEIGEGLGILQPNVSRDIRTLRDDLGLIELASVSSTTIYRKTKIDRILRLSSAVEKLVSGATEKKEENPAEEKADNVKPDSDQSTI